MHACGACPFGLVDSMAPPGVLDADVGARCHATTCGIAMWAHRRVETAVSRHQHCAWSRTLTALADPVE